MIKNLIYLDEQKMYSLSSQIFEGITEYVLSENSTDSQNSESQKGPIGSGKILADVIRSNIRSTEKKFFHDYSYSIFEKYLVDENQTLEISNSTYNADEFEESLKKFSFIKVKLKATFNDAKVIGNLFKDFNRMGEAIAHVTNFSSNLALEKEIAITTEPKEKLLLQSKLKNLSNAPKLAKASGLHQDPTFLSNLSLIVNYGFSDQFEIQQKCSEFLFTSCLKREYLRENEDILIKKYSRKTEKEIVVFGLISQSTSDSFSEEIGEMDVSNLKSALMTMVDHLAKIENSISGKQKNEIVIDPIAVYVDV